MSAVTASICALAAHAAAHLGQGRVALDWLDRVDVIGHTQSSSRFDADVLTASIGPADIPLLVADLAYVRGMVHRQLREEDKAQIWLSKATINGVLTAAAKEALADPNLHLVVTDEETIDSRTDRWDASTAKSRDELDDDATADRRAELLAEGRKLLAKQVGLAAVKQAVAALEDQLEVRMMRLEHGLPVEGQTNHMLLVGPPGTGKTTTAEALGKIYAGMGIVRHPEIREVRRSDFCGHFIGESGPKTNELIEKSLGRIIFMDEFYSLIERHQDGTPDMIGMEAVNQLLVALETHRFDFCFIGAGYEDQVDQFLTVNPGLAGRFNRKLRFESYSPAEIVEIAHRYATPRASLLDDAAREKFLDAATTIRNYTTPGGRHGIDAMQNGRFARNVVERAEGFRDTRVVAQKRAGQPVTVEDLQIISADDIEAAVRSVCSTTATWPPSSGDPARHAGSKRKTASRPARASNSSAVPSRTIPERFANATPTGTLAGNSRSTGRASPADSSTIRTRRERRPRRNVPVPAARAFAAQSAPDSRPPHRGRPGSRTASSACCAVDPSCARAR